MKLGDPIWYRRVRRHGHTEDVPGVFLRETRTYNRTGAWVRVTLVTSRMSKINKTVKAEAVRPRT